MNDADADPLKLAKCCWYGFNHHLDKGEFENWTAEDTSGEWTPAASYKGILEDFRNPPPHSTYEYTVIIADEITSQSTFRPYRRKLQPWIKRQIIHGNEPAVIRLTSYGDLA